ncbi:GDSL-type esterase/lipase family protein [Pedobacter sp. MR2016-24]|uniref:GDSL-type esterase/lipase family protein n=1 Tax=Pedobacter sp. MR2016-24 TaxID=2994466 RepID=UPI002245E2BC|nr:GDSL-type esterase/lipase family protein [Pedobacter sp. MR2016-24]MCX2485803.1 GDSL-type esterase/lipase family protein [Pedobacter sp. MR2016-24]
MRSIFISIVLVICLFSVKAQDSSELKQKGKSTHPSGFHLINSKNDKIKGTIMLLPRAGADGNVMKNAEIITIKFFNKEGFNVAMVDRDQQNSNNQHRLKELLSIYRVLKAEHLKNNRAGKRFDVAGFQTGAVFAARLIERLEESEQPDNVLLIAPSSFNETVPGTVIPQIVPPVYPKAKLYALFAGTNKTWNEAGIDYVKKYKGFDGNTQFKVMPEVNTFTMEIVKSAFPEFFSSKLEMDIRKSDIPNPAAIAAEGYSRARHDEKLVLVAKEKFGLIMMGNSITNNFEKPEYQPVWNQFFAPRKAINLGFSGYRTENLLWNIAHGELEGQSPKVLVLEIGTNNVDEKNYPLRHTAGQLAGGIAAIVKLVRQKLPDTKIILLRCFPGSYDGANPTSHRAILEKASDIVSKLADEKDVFYCDVNHVFLNLDGSINHQMMGDYLHPTPAGAKAWAQAMEPLLSKLMGDQSLDTALPVNTAIVPAGKLENDSYDWYKRHAEVLAVKDSINPEIILIGNSITHFWGGVPAVRYADEKFRIPNGPQSYANLFGSYRVLNMGFGWDRTQNVLWRLDHGELDGLHPRLVVINIGTNNTSETENARINTASEIVEGIEAVCRRVRSKIPNTKILVMAIFPREKDPAASRRILINEINKRLVNFTTTQKISFLDAGPKMLNADGTFVEGMMLDFTHPSEKGYTIWADALRPVIQTELLK